MNFLDPIIAPFKGIELVFTDGNLRRLAIRPWLIGFVAYIFSVVAAVKAHPYLMGQIAPSGSSVGETIIGFFAWIGISLVLLMGTVILTVVIVLICGAVYHTNIARYVLNQSGVTLPAESALAEIGRTAFTESFKLLWLLPLLLLTFILGLIPFLTPFAFILGSLLLSYQFFDYPLEVIRLGPFSRLGFLLSHVFAATLFGATLILIGTIPFVAFLLPPAAVAGASWYLGRSMDKSAPLQRSEGLVS